MAARKTVKPPVPDAVKEVVAETNAKKEIQVVADPVTSLWTIQFTSGGKLPLGLTGFFTTMNEAKAAINTYLVK